MITVVAVICVLALVGALSIRSTSKGEIAGLLNLGGKYLTELDYEQAVVLYLAVIEIDPKCAEAYMGIAEAYLQMGEYDKAMEYAMQGYSKKYRHFNACEYFLSHSAVKVPSQS